MKASQILQRLKDDIQDLKELKHSASNKILEKQAEINRIQNDNH